MLVTRFAPSPTGYLHIGGVRTALYNYLLAKKSGGKYLLRIEDTDLARSDDSLVQPILDGFKRLGLERDAGPGKEDENGPYFQMQRLPIHKKYLQKLLEQGLAYEARESSEELEAMRMECESKKIPFVYRQRQYSDEQLQARKDTGRIPVIRIKVPQEEIRFHDAIKGDVSFHGKDIGDFVLMKADGSPIYYYANMLDDALQGVTLVMRAEEHLSNTPKQIILYNYLGFPVPEFSHLPLMLNPNGKKLSKRHATPEFLISVHQYMEQGFLPEALINFVALVGWNPGGEQEIFSLQELTQLFSLDRVVKSNAVYDFNRALWFNSQYLSKTEDDIFIDKTISYLKEYGGDAWKPYLETINKEYWMSFARHIKVRIQTLAQFRDFCLYFFQEQPLNLPVIYSEKMKCDKETVDNMVPKIAQLLESIALEDWNEEVLKARLVELVQANGLKNGQILWPIRAILTGVEASPGAFEMLEVLGKEESVRRMRTYK